MSQERKLKIGIMTSADGVWLRPAWAEALNILSEKYEITGVCLLPDRLGRKTGIQVPLWYLKTFGLKTTVLLAAFSMLRALKYCRSAVRSWDSLAAVYGITLLKESSANSDAVIEWIKREKIDILLVSVSEVLKDKILSAPTVGIINKHASMLPKGKGVFPFFWSILYKFDLGISFHEVVKKVDNGRVLIQIPYEDFRQNRRKKVSMLGYYRDVYVEMPKLIGEAIDNMVKGNFLSGNSAEGSYYSFPTREDYLKFRALGGNIATFGDIVDEIFQ